MPDPPKLEYARPKQKPPTDWGKVGWTIAAALFMLMCLGFAMMIFLLRGEGGRG